MSDGYGEAGPFAGAAGDPPAHLIIGVVSSAHGLHGEINVFPLTDWPDRFLQLASLLIGRDGRPQSVHRVESVRLGSRTVTLALEGLVDRSQAEALRGAQVLVPIDQAWPLPEGHFYHYQLLGLAVYDLEGQYRGQLTRIYPGPANDCYAVTPPGGGREQLLPALKRVICHVDLAGGKLVAAWPIYREDSEETGGAKPHAH